MKVLGWVAMIAAVVAIVAGLVAAVGVWIVRPDIQARAEELLLAADDGLTRADELLVRVDAGVEAATDAVTKIDATAQSVAADPLIDDATRTELAVGLESFMTGPYADLQGRYAGLQERVESIARTLTAIDRMLPGVDLPGDVAQTLTSIDEAIVKLDATVTGGAGIVTEALTGPSPASRVAEQTRRLSAALATVNELLPKVDERLAQAQARVTAAHDQVGTWFLALSVIVTLLGLYLAGLNVLLYQKGREWAGRAEGSAAA